MQLSGVGRYTDIARQASQNSSSVKGAGSFSLEELDSRAHSFQRSCCLATSFLT